MKRIILMLLIIGWSSFHLSSQGVCTGNLGENIFTGGDFGSGIDPVLATDPGIAPGYNFEPFNVPFDGSYAICSRTNALNGLYGTWLSITDNSSDPNGYMMVVNADFEPGIFYEEVVDGLCENTLYEFSADIINIVKIGVPGHADPNVTFLIDDVSVYSTGNIPKTESWEQFGFSFVTTDVQTSIKLSLRNNAPGGTGNDLALDNISFRACGPASFIGIENEENTIFLCKDDDPLTVVADIEGDDGTEFAILWQTSLDGVNWTDIDSEGASILHTNFDVGEYYYRYLSSGNETNLQNPKCRIISDELIISILPDTYVVADTICEGLIYEFGSQELVSSGFYTEGFISRFGCDSTVLLDVVFMPALDFEFDLTLSDPSCFEFDDGNIQVNSVLGGNGGISYTVTDDTGESINLIYDAGSYNILASDRFGCQEDMDLMLGQPEELVVNLGQDTVIKLGADLNLEPDYSIIFPNINWSGNGLFDCTDCADVNYLPFQSGLVIVNVSDDNGCSTQDSINIRVDEENLVVLPNIFSPNEDRINDLFTINYFGRSVSSVTSFRVYDRWGGLVHSLKNLALDSGASLWDGYSDNKEVATGVYAYNLQVEYINGKSQEINGTFTLIK